MIYLIQNVTLPISLDNNKKAIWYILYHYKYSVIEKVIIVLYIMSANTEFLLLHYYIVSGYGVLIVVEILINFSAVRELFFIK